MKMQRFWVGRALLLAVAVLYAGGYVRAQETKDTLTLTLDRALEIALSDNPTIKVAEEEIALKKVTHKETWQNLLPQASIDGTWNHTISAAQMNLGGQSFKMGMDNSNTVSGVLNISLPIFAPSVYKAMSMTKTDIELAVEKSRASKLDLVNQVTKGYYQLMLTQDSYDVLQKSYKLAEDNYNIVNAKYQQGAVSEFDKISAEVQMRSIKPNVISAGNAVTLSKLQLKVLMGVTADVDIEIADNLGNYETELFANELNQPAANLNNNTTMKQLDLNRKMLNQNIKSLRTNFMPTLGMNYSYQYQSLYNEDWNILDYNWSGSSALMFTAAVAEVTAERCEAGDHCQYFRKHSEYDRQLGGNHYVRYAVRYLGGVRFFGALACHGHYLYHHTDVIGCLIHLSGYHRRRFTEYHLALLSLHCYW